MTLEEKFRIWNATHPTIAEVEIYLSRLKGETPAYKTSLPLVYYKNKTMFEENRFIPDMRQQLYGVRLSDETMLCLEVITKHDFEKIITCIQNVVNESRQQAEMLMSEEAKINYWVMKHYSNPFCALAAGEADIALLQKNKAKIQQTLEVLSKHGVKTPKINWDCLVWLEEGENYCQNHKEKYEVKEYLDTMGDILIFRDTVIDNG